MTDVLQPIVDAVASLKSAVQTGVDEIHKLAEKIVNSADPAEVTATAASIKDAASAILDAVNSVEVAPGTPAPAGNEPTA